MDAPVRERRSWFSFLRKKKPVKPEEPVQQPEETVQPSPIGDPRRPPPAVGIDLGTTFTAVCYIFRGQPKMIHNDECSREITPSVVHFGDHEVLVGEEALKARRDSDRDSETNTVFNIKRVIGRQHDDEFIRGQNWPFEIVEGASGRAAKIAKNVLFEQPTEAVITVPANFSNAQREATKAAGKLAGLNVLQIVNEPTAAALAFSVLNHSYHIRRVLVFDLGGGTFDVSIVEIEGRQTRVLASDGESTLGGSDFDRRIYNQALARYLEMNIDIQAALGDARKDDWTLMEECENAKKALSNRSSKRISHPHYGGQGFVLRRDTFNELCEDLFEKTLTLTDKVVSDASIDEASLTLAKPAQNTTTHDNTRMTLFILCAISPIRDDERACELKRVIFELSTLLITKDSIDEILLVGGSTRIPRIREMVEERFPTITIRNDVEPDLAVAKGAAILAEFLSKRPSTPELPSTSRTPSLSEEDSPSTSSCESTSGESFAFVTLLDVAPFNLGLRAVGDRFIPLIRKNTPIPFTAYEFFTNILEGNNAQASNNETLAKIEIEIPPKPAGKNHVKVSLSIDASGILSVSALDMHTKKEVSITFRSGRMDAQVEERIAPRLRELEQMREHLREHLRDEFRENFGEILGDVLMRELARRLREALEEDD